MPTKSQEHARTTQREAQRKNVRRSQKPAGRVTPPEGPLVAAPTDRGRTHSSARTLNPLDRNRRSHAERRGGAVLEESSTGKPSRKSTRGSIDHTKRTSNLQLRAVRALNAPSNRNRSRG